MAIRHGNAGEWARVKGAVLGLWPVFISLFLFGFSFAILIFVASLLGAFLLLGALAFLIFATNKGLKRVERFYKGARGEEHVARILQNLPSSYHIFNDFIAGHFHVDHLVVGPAGVFSIETKNWKDPVTVNNDLLILVNGKKPNREPINQVLNEAKQVKNELERIGWIGDVTPVLVFASDMFVEPIAEVRGVVVLNASSLIKRFEHTKVVLQQDEIERLIGILKNV